MYYFLGLQILDADCVESVLSKWTEESTGWGVSSSGSEVNKVLSKTLCGKSGEEETNTL